MNTSIFRCCLAAAAFVAVAPLAVGAGEMRVDLDPGRTQVTFTLKATLHTVEGTANLVSGSLVLDSETGTVDGEIVVDATTADTGNTGRDNKMHSKVLLSDSNPRIVFRPTHLDGAVVEGANTGITVIGVVELIGKPHPLSIPMDIRIDGSTFEASAEFTVPYVEWGLRDPSTFILRVAKEVRVKVVTRGTVAPPSN